MAFARFSFLTKEYVRAPVKAERNGAAYDPTGDTVELALKRKPGDESGVTASDPYNDPESGDWATGSWDTKGSQYLAKATVGGSASGADITVAERGIYQLWVRVTAAPETFVSYAGDVEFY